MVERVKPQQDREIRYGVWKVPLMFGFYTYCLKSIFMYIHMYELSHTIRVCNKLYLIIIGVMLIKLHRLSDVTDGNMVCMIICDYYLIHNDK